MRFACLCHDLGKGTTPKDQWPRHIGHEQRGARLTLSLCERLKVPADCRELAVLAAREHGHVHASLVLRRAGPDAPAGTLRRTAPARALRELLLACECDARGRTGLEERPYPQRARLLQALALAQAVDTATLAEALTAQGQAGPQIGQAIQAERVAALRAGIACAP